MTHQQHPIGSGFTAEATAADVIQGIDLSGKNAIVTGGDGGLGLEITRALTSAGAFVTVPALDVATAERALADVDHVEVDRLNLMAPDSIDDFAQRYVASERPLHILIANAGVFRQELVRDARGYESMLATNHLGHFQLVLGLLPALEAAQGARVVVVSSDLHALTDIRWEDPHFTTDDFDALLAYGQSKTANALFAVELDRRAAAAGVRAYAVHPGRVSTTNLAPWIPAERRRAMGVIDEDGNPIIAPERDQKSPPQGASTSVFAATSPLLADTGGVFLLNNDVAPVGDPEIGLSGPGPISGVMPHAVNPVSAQRLWELSEQLLRRG